MLDRVAKTLAWVEALTTVEVLLCLILLVLFVGLWSVERDGSHSRNRVVLGASKARIPRHLPPHEPQASGPVRDGVRRPPQRPTGRHGRLDERNGARHGGEALALPGFGLGMIACGFNPESLQKWCGRPDLNRQSGRLSFADSPQRYPKPLCLPFPPRPRRVPAPSASRWLGGRGPSAVPAVGLVS